MKRTAGTKRELPLLVVTLGDPAGIGPEIVVKAHTLGRIQKHCRPVVLGALQPIQAAAKSLGADLDVVPVESPEDAGTRKGRLYLIDLDNVPKKGVTVGRISAAAGKAAMEYIQEATHMAMEGRVDALVTAPINKAACREAGFSEGGHLEYLGRATRSASYATMLASGLLRVVHLTTHWSLAEACTQIKKARIVDRLRLIAASWSRFNLPKPTIGVAALNPHASEEGLFGKEEATEIEPAVRKARREGIDAVGPVPADSLFPAATKGKFDVTLAMYHDQGHIPVKTHGMEESYSLALGLPMIRTSVDHGTAFDIAGKNVASATSLEVAMAVASELVLRQKGAFPKRRKKSFFAAEIPRW